MTRARDLANIADGTFTATDLDLSGTLTVSGDATFDTNTLFVDVSANAVGVGTTSPSAGAIGGKVLHVQNSGGTASVRVDRSDAATAGTLSLTSGNTTNGLYSTGSKPLVFYTNSTEVARIDSSGRLGIGTSSPQKTLDVTGTFAISNSTTSYWDFDRNDSDGSLTISDTGSEKVRLDTSGNLLVRQTSAVVRDTNTTADVQAFWGNQFSSSNATTSKVMIGTGSSQGYVGMSRVNTDSKYIINSYIRFDNSVFTAGSEAGFMSFFTQSGGTNAAERARIDSSGALLVGTTTSAGAGGVGLTGQFRAGYQGVLNGFGNENASGLFYSGGASTGYTAINSSSGNTPLYISLSSSSTANAFINFSKTGTSIGEIGVEGGDSLYILSDDAGLRFSGGGNVILPCQSNGGARDNALDLGTSGARFVNIYATNNIIQTSDANEKQDIAELDEAERRVAVACKGLLRKFRWKSSIAEKGDDARIHFGIIAQDLQAAFEAEGLDAGRYGMFIHSTWTDEETGEERSRMGVRYSELLAFIIAAL